jgi:hypothetical protein
MQKRSEQMSDKKYYAINKWELTGRYLIGSGLSGHTTAEAAEAAGRESAETYQDHVFVKVVYGTRSEVDRMVKENR